jgi:hypothetical protein
MGVAPAPTAFPTGSLRCDRGSRHSLRPIDRPALLSIGNLRLDRAVVEQVLDAIQPAGIEAALTTMNGSGFR